MIAFLCAISAIASPVCNDHQIDKQWFSQYAQAPTDGTVIYRQSVGDIPMDMSMYAGVIAVEDCRRMGQEAMINVKGRWFRTIIFDCLARNEYNWMQANNIVAELGYYLARKADVDVGEGVRGSLIWLDEEDERNGTKKKLSPGHVESAETRTHPLPNITRCVFVETVRCFTDGS